MVQGDIQNWNPSILLLFQEWCKCSLIRKSHTELLASWRKGSSRTLWETVEDIGIIYLESAVLHYTEVADLLNKIIHVHTQLLDQVFQWALANSVPKKWLSPLLHAPSNEIWIERPITTLKNTRGYCLVGRQQASMQASIGAPPPDSILSHVIAVAPKIDIASSWGQDQHIKSSLTSTVDFTWDFAILRVC